jgi:cysteine-rich repeat protein
VLDTGEACDDGNAADCDGCRFDCTVESAPPSPLCAPAPHPGLSAAQLARFEDGHAEFLESENPGSGLGPVFNGTRCAECHNRPTTGGSSDRTVTRIGRLDGGVFEPLTARGGPLLQSEGISTATCSVPGEVVPGEATLVARRDTPALFGLGLLEAIPELSIRLYKERQKPPISGRYNIVENRVGRFGWKAQIATLHDFAAEAYRDEMGITTPFLPAEHPPQGGAPTCDPNPDPEDGGLDVAAFTDFMVGLAPLPSAPLTREARRGRGRFRRARCHVCHTDRYRTGRGFPVAALRNRRVRAYTDLLLHDMGPLLADGMPQASASGNEFRTAPLWGVRFSAPYLHDGRAATLEQAITFHDGEAAAARDAFLALSPEDRARLIAFLESL